ncbi:MAG: DUF6064 family protein [Rhodospirillales bacterium]
MNLSSGLPYDAEVYAVLMSGYNEQWLPVTLLFSAAGAVLILLAAARCDTGRRSVQLSGIAIAAGAGWAGLMHQWQLMAPLNFMAPVYAGLWGVFVLWVVVRWVIAVPAAVPPDRRYRIFGLMIMTVGLIGYPALQWMSGIPVSGLDYAGTAPNATALFATGAVLAFTGSMRPDLLIIPVLWSAVAGLHAWLLGQPADYLLPAVTLTAVAGLLHVRRLAKG